MARPLRIEYEDAWYHVMNRGLARQTIFLTDKHRRLFLELLGEIHQRFRVEIHAYCLMGNHYHLLVRTPLANLSRAMRHLNGIYTQRFNASQKRDGPIFRGRYKSILIEKDTYLLQLSRYIHLNPVVAHIAKKAEKFQWSSYKFYLKKEKSPFWLHQDETLKYFGLRSQRKKYQMFIEEGIDKEINEYYKKIKRIPILGSEGFIKTVTEKYLKKKHKIKEIPEHKNVLPLPLMEDIIKTVCHYYNVNEDSIFCVLRHHGGNLPRAVVMYLAQTLGQYKLQKIANILTGTSLSGVSRMNRKIIARMMHDKSFSNDIKNITQQLSIISNKIMSSQ